MLDFLYIAVVAVPLVLAGGGLLLLAWRSVATHNDERAARRANEIAVAEANPGGMRRREAPLAVPPSVASVEDIAALSRPPAPRTEPEPSPILGPSAEEIAALAASLAFPPRPASGRADGSGAAPAGEVSSAAPAGDAAPAGRGTPPGEDASAGRASLEVVPPAAASAPPAGRATKQCPDCAEEVLAAARVCKHCRYRWDPPETGTGAALSA